MKKLILYIFVGVFFVPATNVTFAAGSDDIYIPITRDDLVVFISKSDALSTIEKISSKTGAAQEFKNLQYTLQKKDSFSNDELEKISNYYYKACKKHPGTCGDDVDKQLNDLYIEDFDDVDDDASYLDFSSSPSNSGETGTPSNTDETGTPGTGGTGGGTGTGDGTGGGTGDGTDGGDDGADGGDGKGADIAKNILGGASMAAMGIGAMQAAQGISEQKADKEAEADMRAYLQTFKCDYANGKKQVKYGLDDVTLDIGADLVKQATEYRTIAARLKITKKALNMTPGIEEEEIINPADSGLYSYTPAEKINGNYTSLSKAILDEESEDAKEWADQKSKSKKRVIGGAIAAGAGTVLSLTGDKLVDAISEKIKNKDSKGLKSLLEDAGGKEGLDELFGDADTDDAKLAILKEKFGDKLNKSQMKDLLKEYKNTNKDEEVTEEEGEGDE